jgi:hypothetical protein
VAHPFKGDYVELRQNSKWKKVAYDTNDQHLVFADFVAKVNRKNGKVKLTFVKKKKRKKFEVFLEIPFIWLRVVCPTKMAVR